MESDNTAETLASFPEAFMLLLKVQGIYKQRKLDADKPKATLAIANVTREKAQSIADDLCCYVKWGNEHVAPKHNA